MIFVQQIFGAEEIKFDYAQGELGPEMWKTFAPECGGTEQSPVNFVGDAGSDQQFINYEIGALKGYNAGDTLKFELPEKSLTNSFTVGDKVYSLIQFHYHTPSEHAIKNNKMDMEVHFVHEAEDKSLAVKGVMYSVSNEMSGLDTSFDPLLEFSQMFSNSTKETPVTIPGLTLKTQTDERAFNYAGSLTTPPCSEGLDWYVYTSKIPVSSAVFTMINSITEMNARPVQRDLAETKTSSQSASIFANNYVRYQYHLACLFASIVLA